MTKNFIQRGETVSVPAPADVISGALVRVGVLVGVAQHDAASGDPVELDLTGVFDVPKTSAQAWTVGAAIYFNPTSGEATTATTAGNVFIGAAVAAAANPSAIGRVRLNGSAPTATT